MQSHSPSFVFLNLVHLLSFLLANFFSFCFISGNPLHLNVTIALLGWKNNKKILNWNLQSYVRCLRVSLPCCSSDRCFHIYLSYRYSPPRLPITCSPVHVSEKPMKSCFVLICQLRVGGQLSG